MSTQLQYLKWLFEGDWPVFNQPKTKQVRFSYNYNIEHNRYQHWQYENNVGHQGSGEEEGESIGPTVSSFYLVGSQ